MQATSAAANRGKILEFYSIMTGYENVDRQSTNASCRTMDGCNLILTYCLRQTDPMNAHYCEIVSVKQHRRFDTTLTLVPSIRRFGDDGEADLDSQVCVYSD